MSVKGEEDLGTEVSRYLCRLGKPTQKCCSSEGGDAQAKIETQDPALRCPRPSTFKAQVGHPEDDAQNCASHFEKQGRQGDPVNVGQTAIIGILASLPCRSILQCTEASHRPDRNVPAYSGTDGRQQRIACRGGIRDTDGQRAGSPTADDLCHGSLWLLFLRRRGYSVL